MTKRVLVLGGGTSSEREVSLRSAANVEHSLHDIGCEVVMADPAAVDFDLQKLAHDCDVVFPILHGPGGEDGTLQRQLEATHKPFLGSGSIACGLTVDKAKYRGFVTGCGIWMAEGRVVTRMEFESSALRRAPYVLKPVSGGSSIDTVILHDLAREPDAAYFDRLFDTYDHLLLERLIVGQEITVGVLGDEALPVILIAPPVGEEFDYDNKYNGRTQEIVNPQQIAGKTQKQAQALALRLHQLTGCRHLSRTDMIVTPAGELYVLETNTMPGLTEQSLFPKAAAATGYEMITLMQRFLDMALITIREEGH